MRCWQCCAARWIRLGPDAATAAAAKLALNLLMNANIALFAEAFAFVEDHGVDTAVFGNGLTGTAFAAPLFKAIVAGLLAPQDVAQGSDIALSRKDLALLLGSRTLPLTESVHALFDRADQWNIEQQHNPEGGGAHGIQREDDRPRIQGIRFNCLV
jgi:3-hydroxyisobutyrate dehydrogenase-like beta-hydroxyacid dehydrogenase